MPQFEPLAVLSWFVSPKKLNWGALLFHESLRKKKAPASVLEVSAFA
jgi:hypothetical protein